MPTPELSKDDNHTCFCRSGEMSRCDICTCKCCEHQATMMGNTHWFRKTPESPSGKGEEQAKDVCPTCKKKMKLHAFDFVICPTGHSMRIETAEYIRSLEGKVAKAREALEEIKNLSSHREDRRMILNASTEALSFLRGDAA